MAVGPAVETFQDRDVKSDDRGENRTRTFFIETDDATETDVLSASGLPADGDDFPGKPAGTVIVKSIVLDHPGNRPTTWRARVQYGPPEDTPSGKPVDNSPTDPADDPISISGEYEDYLVALDADRDGKAIETTAGEPYDPPIEEEATLFVLVLEKTETAAPYAKAYAHHNRVNDSAFYGAAPETLLVKIGFSNFFWRNPDTGVLVERWKLRYRFKHKAEGWQREILDAGFAELIGGKLVEIVDEEGNRPSNAVKLDGAGRKLADPKAAGNFNTFRTKKKSNFAGLGLGTG